MAAEPQPFFDCATKGTSIQRAGVSAATAIQAPATKNSTSPGMRRRYTSAHRHDNQNDRDGHQHDDQEIAIGERPGGELLLSLLRAGGKVGEVVIVELLNCVFHLLGVNVRGFHGLLRLFRGKEPIQLVDLLLPY